ncbi:lysophospholipid acyltransferase family protein [bacterium]|nr:lysophospholipid acyltransferase family protein [bacterium]
MRRWLETIILRFAMRKVATTPYAQGERIATAAHRLIWPLMKGPRLRALERMSQSLPTLSPHEREVLLEESVRNLSTTAVEVLYMHHLGTSFLEEVEITAEGEEGLEAIAGGGIVLTGHLGNWELAGALITRGLHPTPFMVVGRSQENSLLDEISVSTRKKFGMGHATRDWREAVKLARALEEGTVLGLVSDQHAGSGTPVVFMDRMARAFKGPVVYAQRGDVPLVATACFRVSWGQFRWAVRKPFSLAGLSLDEGAQRYTSEIESLVLESPDQWLWLHNRWKGAGERATLP